MNPHPEVQGLSLTHKQAELLVDALAHAMPRIDPTINAVVGTIEEHRELLEGEWDADADPVIEAVSKLSPDGVEALFAATRYVLEHEDYVAGVDDPWLESGLVAQAPDPGAL